MTRIRDNWHKPRKAGTGRFTTKEIRFIKQEFEAGSRSSDTARELKCASRTVRMHFARLRAEAAARASDEEAAPPAKPSRFYRSTFDLGVSA